MIEAPALTPMILTITGVLWFAVRSWKGCYND